jgi:hypothetical protein
MRKIVLSKSCTHIWIEYMILRLQMNKYNGYMILLHDTMHYEDSIKYKYHMHDTAIWYFPLWPALDAGGESRLEKKEKCARCWTFGLAFYWRACVQTNGRLVHMLKWTLVHDVARTTGLIICYRDRCNQCGSETLFKKRPRHDIPQNIRASPAIVSCADWPFYPVHLDREPEDFRSTASILNIKYFSFFLTNMYLNSFYSIRSKYKMF